MEKLLQKLFFFSKLETGNMPFFPKPVHMDSWLEHYVDDKAVEGENKGYAIEYINGGNTDTNAGAATADGSDPEQQTDVRTGSWLADIDVEQTKHM